MPKQIRVSTALEPVIEIIAKESGLEFSKAANYLMAEGLEVLKQRSAQMFQDREVDIG